MKSAVDENTAREAYQPAIQAYAAAGRPDAFQVFGRGQTVNGESYIRVLGG